MSGMATLGSGSKLFGRSLPAIKKRFNDLLSHLIGERERLGLNTPDRALSRDTLGNIIVLHFLDLGREDQERIVQRYLPGYIREAYPDFDPTGGTQEITDQAGARVGSRTGKVRGQGAG